MDINIYVNQKKINPMCRSAINEYVKRLSPYCNMKIVCASGHIKYTAGHSSAYFAVIPATDNPAYYGYGNYYKGYLDYESSIDNTVSHTISSEKFASQINSITSSGISKLNYYIGFTQDEIEMMETFSVCTISPSNEMTAILLSEQIYRAYTILNNITYHK